MDAGGFSYGCGFILIYGTAPEWQCYGGRLSEWLTRTAQARRRTSSLSTVVLLTCLGFTAWATSSCSADDGRERASASGMKGLVQTQLQVADISVWLVFLCSSTVPLGKLQPASQHPRPSHLFLAQSPSKISRPGQEELKTSPPLADGGRAMATWQGKRGRGHRNLIAANSTERKQAWSERNDSCGEPHGGLRSVKRDAAGPIGSLHCPTGSEKDGEKRG